MERDQWEDVGIDGNLILKQVFEKWDGGTNWLDLAQATERWRALEIAVMNLRVVKNVAKCLDQLRLNSQERLCSMELG